MKVKVKLTLEQAIKTQRGVEFIFTVYLTWALGRGWVVNSKPVMKV
jgi:hypothetical protein